MCLFTNVAPDGMSELTRAGTCATGMSNVRVTRAPSPSQTDLWYQMAGSNSHEREAAPQGHDEVQAGAFQRFKGVQSQ